MDTNGQCSYSFSEARGLETIAADPADGRGTLASLNPAGRDMCERCTASIGPLFVALEQELGEQGFREALPFLENGAKLPG